MKLNTIIEQLNTTIENKILFRNELAKSGDAASKVMVDVLNININELGTILTDLRKVSEL